MGKKNKRNINFDRKFKNQPQEEESDYDDEDLNELLEEETKAINAMRTKKNKTKKKKQEEDFHEEDSDLAAQEDFNSSNPTKRSENIINYKKTDQMEVDSQVKDTDVEEDEEEDEEEESQGEKKVFENNKEALKELKEKLENKFNSKFRPSELFLERLTVSANSTPDDKLNVNDDIKRELVFYNLAFEGAVKAINQLKTEKQKLNRPDDFMAEMLKSDELMVKVKKEILSHEQRIKKFQLREEKMLNKKFNKKTKGKVQKETQEYKKTSKEAIDHWKRSIKENPDEYYKLDDYVNKSIRQKKSMSRKNRNNKFNPKLANKEHQKMNARKSGFNKSQRKPKEEKKRPGKNQRMNNRNKVKSKH